MNYIFIILIINLDMCDYLYNILIYNTLFYNNNLLLFVKYVLKEMRIILQPTMLAKENVLLDRFTDTILNKEYKLHWSASFLLSRVSKLIISYFLTLNSNLKTVLSSFFLFNFLFFGNISNFLRKI